MNKFLTVFLSILGIFAQAQSDKKFPEKSILRAEPEMQMRFLAANEMQGRRTGEMGNYVAARYLAEQFRMLGLRPTNAQTDYLLPVELTQTKPATEGVLIAGKDTLRTGKEMVILASGAVNLTADVVFVGYGTESDLEKIDVKGKIVVAQVGSAEDKNPLQMVSSSASKRKTMAEKGAAMLVEIYSGSFPWGFAARYFNSERLKLADNDAPSTVPHVWINGQQAKYAKLFTKGEIPTATFVTTGRTDQSLRAFNVAGVIEGTDPVLKNEYVILSAHFDHIGTGKKGGGSFSAQDSIFNGARDNAFGTVALLTAAKALAAAPTKRSILVLAFTGEEVGLLGSRYYAEHPAIALKKCVFNLNCDGDGYDDTSIVSIIGMERTGIKAEMEAACKLFGLGVFAEPAPEQGLFDRSDNVSFAAKGIPAPTVTPGFRKFDEVLMKNYHQVSDNPESVDFDYLLKFCQVYAHTARLIANRRQAPFWTADDVYEKAGKALYEK